MQQNLCSQKEKRIWEGRVKDGITLAGRAGPETGRSFHGCRYGPHYVKVKVERKIICIVHSEHLVFGNLNLGFGVYVSQSAVCSARS